MYERKLSAIKLFIRKISYHKYTRGYTTGKMFVVHIDQFNFFFFVFYSQAQYIIAKCFPPIKKKYEVEIITNQVL